MLDVRVKNKLYQFPENWEELKDDTKLYSFVMAQITKGSDPEVLLLKVVLQLLKLPKWKSFLVPVDSATILMERLSYIVKEYPGALKDNPFRKLGRSLYGTTEVWRDMLTWEYAHAEKHFLQYGKTQDENELNLFIAVWYRPRRWWRRIAFDDSNYMQRAEKVARVPMWKKIMIWQHFLHLREEAVQAHENLFSGKESAEDASWADTIIALSQPGDEDKTGAVPAAVILRRLELKAKEAKDLKSKNTSDDNN